MTIVHLIYPVEEARIIFETLRDNILIDNQYITMNCKTTNALHFK